MWDPIVENFKQKLSAWKRNYIFLGGRIALIKASLSNMPIDYVVDSYASGGEGKVGSLEEEFLVGRKW